MILLTRLDGERFVLNADLIRYVESRPDTFITLTTGERVMVTNSLEEVVDLSLQYQQSKHMIPAPHFAGAAHNRAKPVAPSNPTGASAHREF